MGHVVLFYSRPTFACSYLTSVWFFVLNELFFYWVLLQFLQFLHQLTIFVSLSLKVMSLIEVLEEGFI